MRRAIALLVLLNLAGCQEQTPPLSPAEKAAQDRAECQVLATQQTGFDPLTAEAPPRTISTTHRRGGSVAGGAVKGAAGGAALGVVGGAIAGNAGKGAAAGAAVGGLLGGAKRYKESNEMVTRTHTNPDYTAFVEQKKAFKQSFETCLATRKEPAQ